ncbi:hypothetical protein NITHO_4700004 [Nitrolancea hollandica Lb]|uniref:Uncharacterized protein n=1 Tax=Nitrolancea hollandica Lb TaxID=1129897 RepID=I4EKM8_9BACT|nr:hypothetical protein NITHO_4700004 [Nitrolancea hollandica Lb]
MRRSLSVIGHSLLKIFFLFMVLPLLGYPRSGHYIKQKIPLPRGQAMTCVFMALQEIIRDS